MNGKHIVQIIYKRKTVFTYVPKITYVKYCTQKLWSVLGSLGYKQ